MRKILVSLLVVSMVLGLVGTAFAGYSDAATNKHIDKVSAFGWMNGYPDGTFKPAGNITRAEAAAVIVRALGLSAAADAAKGLGTKFTDVPGTHWATGYINVCTTKGILKGYPDGTFKPEANVSNAEVITMIVRALNRESQAVGEWPIGHITVAAAENIITSGFVSSALATRENVATYVSKASDVTFLKLTTNGWEEDLTKTMAKQNDLTVLEDRKVDAYDSEAKTIGLKNTTTNVTNTYDLVANYVIGEGKALRDLVGYTVDAYVNDDDDVVYVAIVTASTSKTGVIKTVGGSGVAGSPYYFYLDGDSKKYDLAIDKTTGLTSATIFRNSVTAAFTSFKIDDTVDFYMENNVVTYVKATRNDITDAIVEAVRATGDISSQYVRYDKAGAPETKYMDAETVVTIDGTKSTLANVKEDMVVSIQLDPNDKNTALAITASSKKVSGKITAKRNFTDAVGDVYWYLSIDGVEYRIGASPRLYDTPYATGGGYANVYNATTVGDAVTAYLAPNGRINQLDVTTGTANYGKVVGKTLGGDYDKWTVDVKGTQVVYELEDGADKPVANPAIGDYVRLVRNNAGRLIDTVANKTAVVVLPAAVDVTDVMSGNLAQVNGVGAGWYSYSEGAIVYVDGNYATSIPDGARIKYLNNGVKLTFAVVDTVSEVDSGLIASLAAQVIKGEDDAVEDNSTIVVFTDPTEAGKPTATLDMTKAVALTALPVADQVGTIAGGNTCTTNADGGFTFKLPVAQKGQTVYLRITDSMGQFTVLSLVVTN